MSYFSVLVLMILAMKYAKCVMPHVALLLLLSLYVTIGAAMFIWIERDIDIHSRSVRFGRIRSLYDLYINETVRLVNNNHECNRTEFTSTLRPVLSRLSIIHDFSETERSYHQDVTWIEMYTEHRVWTLPASIFYALTVTASTGYGGATPSTVSGRVFTVVYGLFGIPLLFLTAADFGMLLSGLVRWTHKRVMKMTDHCRRAISESHKRHAHPLTESTELDDQTKLDPSTVPSSTSMSKKREAEAKAEADEIILAEKLQLPLYTPFVVIIGYCCVGSLMYNYVLLEPEERDFILGLFFSFNAVSTVGLGTVHTTSILIASGVCAYTICGLAMITMCVELASLQVKAGFNKLHYYGTELHKALGVIQNWRVLQKGNLTWHDLLHIVETYKIGAAIAFTPEDADTWRYIDAEAIECWERQYARALIDCNGDEKKALLMIQYRAMIRMGKRDSRSFENGGPGLGAPPDVPPPLPPSMSETSSARTTTLCANSTPKHNGKV